MHNNNNGDGIDDAPCRPSGRHAGRLVEDSTAEMPAGGSAAMRCRAAHSEMDMPRSLGIIGSLRKTNESRAKADKIRAERRRMGRPGWGAY